MPSALFLTQRIPYPPTKGEKIRSYRVLMHLRKSFDVHLGCLVDDPDDEQHVATVEALCAGSHVARIDRRRAKLTCLTGLLTGDALSVTFYRDRALQAWVDRTRRDIRPDAIVVLSSNMAPYVLQPGAERVRLCDLVDVDSEKWRAYAQTGKPPMSLVHRREWHRVAALEARIAQDFDWSTFVSNDEAALFQSLVPTASAKIRAIPNGVDADYFDPAIPRDPPFAPHFAHHRPRFVFTGTMDYPPNVDAARWFARDILPLIHRDQPHAHFHIVGANPTPDIRALQSDTVHVTGRVADIRPYIAHASVCVAPMRIARGIQNKVLEALAMARPTVVTSDALEGIDATPGRDLLLANDPAAFAAACLVALRPESAALGHAARTLVARDYAWGRRMAGFDPLLADPFLAAPR